MKKTIIRALAVSTLLLSACSTSQPMWRKAGITPHDVNNALAKCRYDVGLAKVNQNEKSEMIQRLYDGTRFQIHLLTFIEFN